MSSGSDDRCGCPSTLSLDSGCGCPSLTLPGGCGCLTSSLSRLAFENSSAEWRTPVVLSDTSVRPYPGLLQGNPTFVYIQPPELMTSFDTG